MKVKDIQNHINRCQFKNIFEFKGNVLIEKLFLNFPCFMFDISMMKQMIMKFNLQICLLNCCLSLDFDIKFYNHETVKYKIQNKIYSPFFLKFIFKK